MEVSKELKDAACETDARQHDEILNFSDEKDKENEFEQRVPVVDEASKKRCEVIKSSADDKEMNGENLLKEGPVLYVGGARTLQLTSKGMKLVYPENQQNKSKLSTNQHELEFPWQYVITAEMNTSTSEDNLRRSFNLHFMIEQPKKTLQAKCINLATVNELADEWVDIIRDNCAKVPGRPKKMLVLVNSIGGMGNAAKIYQKKVAPIFQLAKITTTVIYTEKPKQARDVAEHDDLSQYDCVVAVGGDGTNQEILHGMTVKMQRSAGVDFNDVESTFAGLNKPLGIIPAGSGNCLVSLLNRGSRDVETAAFRILIGEIHRSQVFTVHSGGKFVTVAGLSFHYGALSEVTKRIEELRWMKRSRYRYAGFMYLFKRKKQACWSLEYFTAPARGGGQNDDISERNEEESISDHRWIQHNSQGRRYGNLMCSTACMTFKQDPKLKKPFSDRSTLYVDLGCATLNLYRVCVSVLCGWIINRSYVNMDVIENVQGARLKLIQPEGEDDRSQSRSAAGACAYAAFNKTQPIDCMISADGECFSLESPEFEFRVVPSFAPLYASHMSTE